MTVTPNAFERDWPGVGTLTIRPLQIPQDMPQLRRWLSSGHAHYWGMQDMDEAALAGFYRELAAAGGGGYLGLHQGQPAFLIEVYDPARAEVGGHYEVQPGDLGMHLLVAPTEQPIRGFTRAVFRTLMGFLFEPLQARRIVVEPDLRNDPIHVLNRYAGFEYEKIIELKGKRGHLAFCSAAQFATAMATTAPALPAPDPHSACAHLNADAWALANRRLLAKAIAELAHERLIEPRPVEGDAGRYRLTPDSAGIEYRFRARRLALDHWLIDAASIEKRAVVNSVPLDAVAFITEFRHQLGIAEAMLGTYLEEVSSTLNGAVYKLGRPGLAAHSLLHAGFQELERAMDEGHPCFIANNGRIGFDANDYHAYTPEAGAPLRLLWLAGHVEATSFACSTRLDYASLLREELGDAQFDAFQRQLEAQGLDPTDYRLIPVHPWQWFNKLAHNFAADLAERRLVCLGYGEDHYQAQQSIRTFFNLDHPERRYVKTALSILNMGFMRGLSPHYMDSTPAISDFLHALIEHDPYLAQCGFTILREQAGVGYRAQRLEGELDRASPYLKMLSALWRESPLPQLQAGERLMTMAGLLHRDAEGRALLPALIQTSGLSPEDWLRRYLDAYLRPLLHCFYAHDLVFMPHGENLILILKDHVPVRVLMKDIGEEAAILNAELVLGERVRRLQLDMPDGVKTLSLFTDVFDCFFRFLSALLVEQEVMGEDRFWTQVAACIRDYQEQHPELADKFHRHDLFAPEFTLSCLNRLQLKNNQQLIDLTDPTRDLEFHGTLINPIARLEQRARQRNVC